MDDKQTDRAAQGVMAEPVPYKPALSEQAVEQLMADARESMGEIAVLDTPQEQAGGYIALHTRLVEIAGRIAHAASAVEPEVKRLMTENNWPIAKDAAGTALLFGDKVLIVGARKA